MWNSRIYIASIFTLLGSLLSEVWGQSAFNFISQDVKLSASNYCVYPDSIDPVMTDAPHGKKPFYISHYGRHGSRYLSNRRGYDIPYNILSKADSLGKLTPLGKQVLNEVKMILDDTEGRWGDLTDLGNLQQHKIARRMVERFPEVFADNSHIDARSTTVIRCILSMGTAMQEIAALNPKLQIDLHASRSDMWYMNHQDEHLRKLMKTPITEEAYNNFSASRIHNPRLMKMLFNDSIYAKEHGDEEWLNYYLIKTALIQQNTDMRDRSNLFSYFSYEEIHQFWQRENAWWYFSYGPSTLNGGTQPYTQRFLLRRIIEQADSCIRLPQPGAQLRFGHETILLPLVCLMGINGYDYQTANLEELEESGWWACLVFPMASNLQIVFYRENPKDQDVLVKVLLNEKETRLPLPDDLAPYYHWKDFRKYYLKKIDDYEASLATNK